MMFALLIRMISLAPEVRIQEPKFTGFSTDSSALSIHFIVDRMAHYTWESKKADAQARPALPSQPERYSLTCQVRNNGDFFLELIYLQSPWRSAEGPENTGLYRSEGNRILVTPGRIRIYAPEGGLLHDQSIGDLSWAEGVFSGTGDPAIFFQWVGTIAGDPEIERYVSELGGVFLDNGFVSLQDCGQTGPLRNRCDPGICTRIIYDQEIWRPILAEHAMPGKEPYYTQYYSWSEDGLQLEKSMEKERIDYDESHILIAETVSHYFDFSMKIN